jgi:hypothetical protein
VCIYENCILIKQLGIDEIEQCDICDLKSYLKELKQVHQINQNTMLETQKQVTLLNNIIKKLKPKTNKEITAFKKQNQKQNQKLRYRIIKCEICGIDCYGTSAYTRHINGRHK